MSGISAFQAIGDSAETVQVPSTPPGVHAGDAAQTAQAIQSGGFATLSSEDQSVRAIISPYWWNLSGVFLLISLMSLTTSQTLPPPDLAVPLVSAIMLVFIARWLAPWEARGDSGALRKVLVIGLLMALPMFLFGFGMADLAGQGEMPWKVSLGAIIVGACVAEIIQSARCHAMFLVQCPCWTGVALVEGSLATYVALAAAIVLAWFVSKRQISILREREKAHEAEARSNRRAQEILKHFEEMGQGWFWETDRRNLLTYVSPVVGKLLRRPVEKLLGRPFTELFNLRDGNQGDRTLVFHLSSRSSFHELAVQAAVDYGDAERFWSISGRAAYDGLGNFVGFRGSGHDLTEKRRSQEQASRLAHFDSLTGLANRHQMSLTLEKILGAPHERSRQCTVFLLDLDRFKQVNDTLGHPVGDWLLKQVAQRLQRVVGPRGMVGRLGGDEFQIIIPGQGEKEFLADLASSIIDTLSQSYSIEGNRVVIGASIGIALAPQDGNTSEALIRNSDLALYAAKDGGRGGYHFYAQDLHLDAEERRQVEHDLREAIHNGGFELFYQPVVNTATEQISGFEALLRWNHPTKGHLSPGKFVEVAEDTGLIATIGEWVLRTACQDLSRMPETVRIAVNLSALQFANPKLPVVIANALAQAGVRPDRLELEITESVFLNDDASTEAMFAALKRVGVRLALDDFGTGYSSLGYLRKAPFDKIKIDQSFVRGATEPGSRNGAIIASITSLADALGMETTAEGVETMDELHLVRLLGCSHVQGYIYDKPLSCVDAFARLRGDLQAIARGPKAARDPRQTVVRKVVLDHQGSLYNGTIRNISHSGALIEGLWNVPIGTRFLVRLSETASAKATVRWAHEDRMGVGFSAPLETDASGSLIGLGSQMPELMGQRARNSVRKQAG